MLWWPMLPARPSSETAPRASLAQRAEALRQALSEAFPPQAPGIGVGLVDGPESVSFGLGQAHLDPPGAPFTASTHFRACSLTKQFVALLLLQMEEEGRLRLDDPPGRHVPAYSSFDPALTLLDLAQNRSGLVDYWCAAMLTGARPESRFTLDDGQRLLASLPRQMFAPGAFTRYNNGNWRILQQVIESVSRQPLGELLRQRIFEPLGMHDSGLGEDTEAPLKGGTRGYREIGGRWEREITRIEWSGDAALVTHLDDLLKWEAALLQGNPRLGPTHRLADARAHASGALEGAPAPYAFGLNVSCHAGRRMHWHGGALRGFRMVHLRFPDDGAAVVVMLNRTADPLPVALDLAARLGWSAAWPSPEAADASVIGLPDPAGAYACEALDLVAEFSEHEGICHLSLGMGRQRLVRTDVDRLATIDGFTEVRQHATGLSILSRHLGCAGHFLRLGPPGAAALPAGRRYHCAELRSHLQASADGRSVHFEGPLGQSESYGLRALGDGWLAFDCLRALDEAPPGRFHLRTDESGGLHLSCLLAQGFRFLPH